MRQLVRALLFTSCAALSGVAVSACCATAPAPVQVKPPPPKDSDGDGIVDTDDQCPEVAGIAQLGGCMDTDGDGFPDNTDKCPVEKGDVDHQGCPPPPPPDADQDGILDQDDACPNEAGQASANGCPDRDGDTIKDADDACPDQAGTIEDKGCLPKAAQKFAGAIKGITFDVGKPTIKKASYRTLDDAVKILNNYPILRLEVDGHTDDQGPDEDNMRLSQARADAVRQYMLDKGIAPERVEAKGFGETMPVVPNTSAGNRAKNRRIEFKLLGKK